MCMYRYRYYMGIDSVVGWLVGWLIDVPWAYRGRVRRVDWYDGATWIHTHRGRCPHPRPSPHYTHTYICIYPQMVMFRHGRGLTEEQVRSVVVQTIEAREKVSQSGRRLLY